MNGIPFKDACQNKGLKRRSDSFRSNCALMCAGNTVAIGGGCLVACIDRKDADSHKNDRGDHQDGKKGGILGGHIRKLFRRLPDKFDGTNSLAGLANGPTRLIAARTTAISYTRKKLPATERDGRCRQFYLEKTNWRAAVAKQQRDD
ncbi:hypothetical protein [Brucella sp. 10RB9214]|uniref:hypothetical protein n=1 Tax=Brucella sp. 10RB9214 TaxID=1844040 RepID=UPI00189E5038|nr:hypothetical protein [Brucella sp. 10RB9214]